MLNIKSISGQILKKELGIPRAQKRVHNKSKIGGEFVFTLSTKKYPEFRIYGIHNIDGEIIHLDTKEVWEVGFSPTEPEPTIIIDSMNYKTITLDYVIEQIKLGMNIK